MRLLPLASYEIAVLSVAPGPVLALDYTGLGGLNEHSFGEEPLGAALEDAEFACSFLRAHGIESRALARFGDAIAEIVKVADEWNPDLLILGLHHHGLWERLLSSSVAGSVLHRWRGSMLLVPATPPSLK
jgi:nucleotide-binding universal stress UspA family protein